MIRVKSLGDVPNGIDLLIADTLTLDEVKGLRVLQAARVCLADPKIKLKDEIEVARLCDFVIVGSFEHRKAMDSLGIPAVEFTFLPLLEQRKGNQSVEKEAGEPLSFGYHGNRVHLDTFAKKTLKVIDSALGQNTVVLKAHYNIERLGLWSTGKLRNIEVQHIPWHPEETFSQLENVDVGLVPNKIPHPRPPYSLMPRKLSNPFWRINRFGVRKDDYDLRFKVTSNAGRIYPFGRVSVPVIADYYPSSASLVRDGVDGFLCLTDEHWATAVNTFIETPSLARSMGVSLSHRVEQEFDSEEAWVSLVESTQDFLKSSKRGAN